MSVFPSLIFPLYAICDEETCRKQGISSPQFYKNLVDGGVQIIQYRNKISSVQETYNYLRELKKLTPSSVCLVSNDFPEAAWQLGLSLHVGQEDPLPSSEFPYSWGLSTHNLTEIQKAVELNADYIGFGTVFSSPTKPHIQPAEIEIAIEHWHKEIVFIGGISLDNIPLLLSRIYQKEQVLQRFYFAVISDFFRYGKTYEAIQNYIKEFSVLVKKSDFQL